MHSLRKPPKVIISPLPAPSPRCSCEDGYTGKHCDSLYVPCHPSPCRNGGSCTARGAYDYTCSCPKGESRLYLRLLPSWPLEKVLTGPAGLKIPLAGIQNPGVFISCVSSCLELYSTHITEPTKFMWLYMWELFLLKYCRHICQVIGFNVVWLINNYIYQSAVSCLWNKAQDKRKHVQ